MTSPTVPQVRMEKLLVCDILWRRNENRSIGARELGADAACSSEARLWYRNA